MSIETRTPIFNIYNDVLIKLHLKLIFLSLSLEPRLKTLVFQGPGNRILNLTECHQTGIRYYVCLCIIPWSMCIEFSKEPFAYLSWYGLQ